MLEFGPKGEFIIKKIPGRMKWNNITLKSYFFQWTEKTVAISLGYGSMYNHSYDPNGTFDFNYRGRTMVYKARRPIAKGEEITINYQGAPDDPTPVWFAPHGDTWVFSTAPQIRNYPWNVITEIIGTFVLVFVVLSFGHTPHQLGPLAAALLVVAIAPLCLLLAPCLARR